MRKQWPPARPPLGPALCAMALGALPFLRAAPTRGPRDGQLAPWQLAPWMDLENKPDVGQTCSKHSPDNLCNEVTQGGVLTIGGREQSFTKRCNAFSSCRADYPERDSPRYSLYSCRNPPATKPGMKCKGGSDFRGKPQQCPTNNGHHVNADASCQAYLDRRFRGGPAQPIDKSEFVRRELETGVLTCPTDAVYAIGDLHGDLQAAHKVLKSLRLVEITEQGGVKWIGESACVVVVGNLADRGDDFHKLLKLFDKLQKEALQKGGKVVVLMGNHEIMNLKPFKAIEQNKYATLEHVQQFCDKKYHRDHPSEEEARYGKHATEACRKEFYEMLNPLTSDESKPGSYYYKHAPIVVYETQTRTIFTHGGVSAPWLDDLCKSLEDNTSPRKRFFDDQLVDEWSVISEDAKKSGVSSKWPGCALDSEATDDQKLQHTKQTVAYINLEMRRAIQMAHQDNTKKTGLDLANSRGGFWREDEDDPGKTGPLWSRYLPVTADDWPDSENRGRRVLEVISEHGRLGAADRMVIGHTPIGNTVTAWCVSSSGSLTKPSPSKPCPDSGGFSRLIGIDVAMSRHMANGRTVHPSDALMIAGCENKHEPASGLDPEETGSQDPEETGSHHAQLYHLSPPEAPPAKVIPLRFS